MNFVYFSRVGLRLEKTYERITAPKKNAGIRLRHLQKRSLPRKAIIFALQMSIKYLALLVAFR